MLFCVAVYDLLSGEIVKVMKGHTGCVRDVSWHPYRPELASSSVSPTLQLELSCPGNCIATPTNLKSTWILRFLALNFIWLRILNYYFNAGKPNTLD